MDEQTSTLVAHYLATTDTALLTQAADGLDAAYSAFWTARGRVSGVEVDLISAWDSASGRSMRGYLGTVETALAETGGTLTLVADALRAHAKVAAAAREQAGTFAREIYMDPLSHDMSELDGILSPFLDSVKTLTKDLWAYGAIAPGGIPLPEPPPPPPSSWKDWVFGSDYPPFWYWESDGKPPLGPGADLPGALDPENPFYGYDEWGNRVPAFQAAMPIPGQIAEAGVGSLLKVLAKIGRAGGYTASGARAIGKNADDLAGLVKGSYGWRAEHIDRHIREWYRLADDAPVQPWMRDEYLKMVVDSGVKQGKVFSWSLRGETGAQQTYSTLRFQNGRWLVSQYYAAGERAGEFATAFEPTERQLARMLQQSGIVP